MLRVCKTIYSWGMDDTDGGTFLNKKTFRSGFVVYVEAWVKHLRASFSLGRNEKRQVWKKIKCRTCRSGKQREKLKSQR